MVAHLRGGQGMPAALRRRFPDYKPTAGAGFLRRGVPAVRRRRRPRQARLPVRDLDFFPGVTGLTDGDGVASSSKPWTGSAGSVESAPERRRPRVRAGVPADHVARGQAGLRPDRGEAAGCATATAGSTLGQSCLLARRLVERGVPFVTVNDRGWDTHDNLMTRLKEGTPGPRSASAWSPRSTWPSPRCSTTCTTAACSTRRWWSSMGEFGRTPKLNTAGGRDHWPRVFSVRPGGRRRRGRPGHRRQRPHRREPRRPPGHARRPGLHDLHAAGHRPRPRTEHRRRPPGADQPGRHGDSGDHRLMPSLGSSPLFCLLALLPAPDGLASEPPVTALAFAPDGRSVLAGSQAGLDVRSWPDLKPVRKLPTTLSHIHDLAFSPRGDVLAAGGGSPAESGAVELFRWPEGTRFYHDEPHDDLVYALAWKDDGSAWASASHDRTVQVHAPGGETVRALEGHSKGVVGLCYLPDGRSLVSAGIDQSLRVWDAESGRPLRRLENHTGPVRAWPSARRDPTAVRRWSSRLAQTGRSVLATDRRPDGSPVEAGKPPARGDLDPLRRLDRRRLRRRPRAPDRPRHGRDFARHSRPGRPRPQSRLGPRRARWSSAARPDVSSVSSSNRRPTPRDRERARARARLLDEIEAGGDRSRPLAALFSCPRRVNSARAYSQEAPRQPGVLGRVESGDGSASGRSSAGFRPWSSHASRPVRDRRRRSTASDGRTAGCGGRAGSEAGRIPAPMPVVPSTQGVR